MSHNQSVKSLHGLRSDAVKSIVERRPTKAKGDSTIKNCGDNHEHKAVLQETRIIYDQPLLPTQVLQLRQERLAKQKSKKVAAGAQSARQTASAGATVQAVANATDLENLSMDCT